MTINVKYKRVLDVWVELYPPTIPWNNTVWRANCGRLKKMYFDQGYTPEDVVDAIRYCKMRGKQLTSLGYLAYVIEAAKVYYARQRQQEQTRRLSDIANTAQPQPQPNIPQSAYSVEWLNVDESEDEVE